MTGVKKEGACFPAAPVPSLTSMLPGLHVDALHWHLEAWGKGRPATNPGKGAANPDRVTHRRGWDKPLACSSATPESWSPPRTRLRSVSTHTKNPGKW